MEFPNAEKTRFEKWLLNEKSFDRELFKIETYFEVISRRS